MAITSCEEILIEQQGAAAFQPPWAIWRSPFLEHLNDRLSQAPACQTKTHSRGQAA